VDYFGILKQGWQVAWRNKALWVLGLFAMGSSVGSSFSNALNTGKDSSTTGTWLSSVPTSVDIIAISALVGVLVIVLLVLSVAARAGLIAETDRVCDSERVSLSRGWRTGFHYWWRTFGIQLVLALPVIAVLLLIGGIAVIALIGAGAFSYAGNAASGAVIVPLVLLAFLAIVVIVPVSVLISLLSELSLRYGILRQRTLGAAISAAWGDVRAKRGAFVMWLVMLLPGIVYGTVVSVLLLITLVPLVLAARTSVVIAVIVLLALVVLVVIVTGAVYSTFQCASWTVFFRAIAPATPVESFIAPVTPVEPFVASAAPVEPLAAPVADV